MALSRGRSYLRFGLDFGTLLFGAGTAQVIALALMPIVTRLFSRADFGSAAFFVSLVSFLAPLASLRYEQAILLPKEEAKARRLSVLALVLAVLMGVLLLTGLLVWNAVFGLGAARELGWWIYALPLAVVLNVANLTFGLRRTRDKAFRTVSVSGIAGSSTMGLTRIGLGSALGSSVGALIASAILGDLSRIGILSTGGRRQEAAEAEPPPKAEELWEVAREHADFPCYAAPTALFNRFSASLPVFMLTYFFGPAVVGAYALTERAIRGPLELASQSARRVFLQRGAARINESRTLRDLYGLTSLALIGMSLVPVAVIYFYGTELFGFVFGPEWSESGDYARALIPWFLVLVPTSVVNGVFFVSRRLGWWLGLQIFLAIAGLTTFSVCRYLGWSVVKTIGTFAWVNLGFYTLIALLAWALVQRPPRGEVAGS